MIGVFAPLATRIREGNCSMLGSLTDRVLPLALISLTFAVLNSMTVASGTPHTAITAEMIRAIRMPIQIIRTHIIDSKALSVIITMAIELHCVNITMQ